MLKPCSIFILGGLLLAGSATAAGQDFKIPLERPGERDFIVDRANLISEADEKRIRTLCDKLLTNKATPILVVTIESMAEHGANGMRIETFATLLFNQWEIGHAKLNGQTWNTGILLLVSKNDRKARIELGGYWRHDQDALAEKIMQEQIVPRFKQGDFSGGIVAGVESLDKMARGLKMPAAPAASQSGGWMQYLLIAGVIALAIFSAISLARSGSSGWAWLLWGALFAGLGYFLYQMFNNDDSDGGWSGGSFSGGSFGGGFSGGGGATGSW